MITVFGVKIFQAVENKLSRKVLENENPGQLMNFLVVQNKQYVALTY